MPGRYYKRRRYAKKKPYYKKRSRVPKRIRYMGKSTFGNRSFKASKWVSAIELADTTFVKFRATADIEVSVANTAPSSAINMWFNNLAQPFWGLNTASPYAMAEWKVKYQMYRVIASAIRVRVCSAYTFGPENMSAEAVRQYVAAPSVTMTVLPHCDPAGMSAFTRENLPYSKRSQFGLDLRVSAATPPVDPSIRRWPILNFSERKFPTVSNYITVAKLLGLSRQAMMNSDATGANFVAGTTIGAPIVKTYWGVGFDSMYESADNGGKFIKLNVELDLYTQLWMRRNMIAGTIPSETVNEQNADMLTWEDLQLQDASTLPPVQDCTIGPEEEPALLSFKKAKEISPSEIPVDEQETQEFEEEEKENEPPVPTTPLKLSAPPKKSIIKKKQKLFN